MSIIRLLLPLLFFISLTSSASVLLKKTFGQMLPVVIAVSALVLYFSQYNFFSYQPGFILMVVLAIAGIPLIAFRSDLKKLAGTYALTPGLVSFVVIFVFAGIILYGKTFRNWDEYTHWGIMIKDCLRTDHFYCVPGTRVPWHRDYPPLNCMLGLVWSKLAGYSEGGVTMMMQIFTLSFILPRTAELLGEDRPLSRSNFRNSLITAVALEFLILMVCFIEPPQGDPFRQRILNSILSDYLMPFMFAWLCLKTFLQKEQGMADILGQVIVASALMLIKQVGCAFFMTAIFFQVVTHYMVNRTDAGYKSKIKRYLLQDLLTFIIPVGMYISWSMYKGRFIDNGDFSYTNGQFNLRQIKPVDYINAVLGRTQGIQKDTFRAYCKALIFEPLFDTPIIKITYAAAFIICVLLIVVLLWTIREKQQQRSLYALLATFLVGTSGYAFMMSVLYLFCFPDNEKAILAGYIRYMSSYVLGEFLILLALLLLLVLIRYGAAIRYRALILACALMALVHSEVVCCHMAPQMLIGNPYHIYQPFAQKLYEQVPADARVFLVYDQKQDMHPHWWGPMQLFVQYFNDDVEICQSYSDAYAVDYDNTEVKNRIVNVIGSCDYLYVIHEGENFDKGMSEFTDGDHFASDTIYKVSKDNGLRLVRVQ